MQPPLILAIDAATQTGWAIGRHGETPRHGSVRLAPPGSRRGAIGSGFVRWFTDIRALERLDAVYIEAPRNPEQMGGRTNFATVRILIGLSFMAEGMADLTGAFRIEDVEAQKVRKHFIGHSRPKMPKKEVMAACRARGWHPVDDNAADALAIWSFATDHEQKLRGLA